MQISETSGKRDLPVIVRRTDGSSEGTLTLISDRLSCRMLIRMIRNATSPLSLLSFEVSLANHYYQS